MSESNEYEYHLFLSHVLIFHKRMNSIFFEGSGNGNYIFKEWLGGLYILAKREQKVTEKDQRVDSRYSKASIFRQGEAGTFEI